MFFKEKDYTIHVILIIGFLLTVILQIAVMSKQYEIEQRASPQRNDRGYMEGERGMYTPSEGCEEQGMRAHFSESTGQYDGCVPMDYIGI